jgi:hypothetical protein
MDSEKFDQLIKRLAQARIDRMTAVRGLVGGTAAALTGAAIATDDAEAKGKKKGKKGGKSSKKGKKKSRRNQNLYTAPAPSYDTGPAPAPKAPEKPKEEAPKPAPEVCEEEYCGDGQYWDTKDCRCQCKKDGYTVCRVENAYDDYDRSLYGTCVNTDCGYLTYDEKSCSCYCDQSGAKYCDPYDEYWDEYDCKCRKLS